MLPAPKGSPAMPAAEGTKTVAVMTNTKKARLAQSVKETAFLKGALLIEFSINSYPLATIQTIGKRAA